MTDQTEGRVPTYRPDQIPWGDMQAMNNGFKIEGASTPAEVNAALMRAIQEHFHPVAVGTTSMTNGDANSSVAAPVKIAINDYWTLPPTFDFSGKGKVNLEAGPVGIDGIMHEKGGGKLDNGAPVSVDMTLRPNGEMLGISYGFGKPGGKFGYTAADGSNQELEGVSKIAIKWSPDYKGGGQYIATIGSEANGQTSQNTFKLDAATGKWTPVDAESHPSPVEPYSKQNYSLPLEPGRSGVPTYESHTSTVPASEIRGYASDTSAYTGAIQGGIKLPADAGQRLPQLNDAADLPTQDAQPSYGFGQRPPLHRPAPPPPHWLRPSQQYPNFKWLTNE